MNTSNISHLLRILRRNKLCGLQKFKCSTVVTKEVEDNSANINIENANVIKENEVVEKNSNPNGKGGKLFKKNLLNGPNLKDFFTAENLKIQNDVPEDEVVPYLQNLPKYGHRRKVYFDIYGCQMNVNDTEIIWSILKRNNFLKTDDLKDADVVLIITCSIRDGAEQKIWNRLDYIRGIRKQKIKFTKSPMKIGILGCMAERLKEKILEKDKIVDLVAGPDSYKDLPRMLALTENDQTAVNVLLSLDETYADIMPVRLNENSVTAFVSIMRGCDNMCTYCIVPFTRGRERSRPINSLIDEVKQLVDKGVKEITLLGQNVNSYRDTSKSEYYVSNYEDIAKKSTALAKGFKTVYKSKVGGLRFADLLDKVADVDPEIRIRFTSPHPKDFPDEVLQVIKERPNVCKSLHIPAQSGNSAVLDRMRRGYTRESYLELIDHIRQILPNVALSSDFICGFCGETDEEFADTLSLIDLVKYNNAYLFPYSMREKTTAHRRYIDDVPPEVKHQRLTEMIKIYRSRVHMLNNQQIGQIQLILVEGFSKRSNLNLVGRNDANIKVIFPAGDVPSINGTHLKSVGPGDYIAVLINNANSQILKGIPLYHTKLVDFHNNDFTKCQYSCLEYSSML